MLKTISTSEDIRVDGAADKPAPGAPIVNAEPDHSKPPTAAAPTAIRQASTKSRKSKRRQVFDVSLWVTNLHDVEIGIYQHSRHEAKSRQFTKDMDLFGEIKVDGERTALLGYREELWKNQHGMDKRLVIKLFSPSVNWRATMDLMVGRSLQLSHGAHGVAIPAFSLNLDSHEQVVQVERSAHKWPGMPESFSFFILEEGQARFYRLRRNWFTITGNYSLFDERDRKVASLDGHLLNIGGRWTVKLAEEHAYPKLQMVLQLFCGMLRFNRGVRSHIAALTTAMHHGKIVPKIEKTEADLYMNPRRVR